MIKKKKYHGEDSMINVFDITEFGAVGDGICDCTQAIQTALDEAAKCRGKVIVPSGKYLTGKLNMSGSMVTLEGSSAWAFRENASTLILKDDISDCLLDITGAFGCCIKGIGLEGSKIGKNIHGIKLYWSEYNGGGSEDTPTIDNCRISGFSGDGVHLEHIWCFSVRHSMLAFNMGAGLFIDGWDGFLLDNWFTFNQKGGLNGKVASSLTCTGNRVEWNRKGGFILPKGDSYNITGNFFDRTYGPALIMGGDDKNSCVDAVAVTGNIFRRNGASDKNESLESPDMSTHISMKNCTNITVTGNTMRTGIGDNGLGNESPDYAFILTDCKNCIIENNVVGTGALKKSFIFNGDNTASIIANNI